MRSTQDKLTMTVTMKIALTVLTTVAGVMAPLQTALAWGRFDGGIHPNYDPHFHRDPVVVHRSFVNARDARGGHGGGGGGCVGCGLGAAAVVGLVGGAIIGASLAANAEEHHEYHEHEVIVESPPPTTVIVQGPQYGTQVAGLPPGCANMNINGATYYRCDQYWYQPYMGGNGVYYTLVPPPM